MQVRAEGKALAVQRDALEQAWAEAKRTTIHGEDVE